MSVPTIEMHPWDEGPKLVALKTAANVLYNAQLSGKAHLEIDKSIARYSDEGAEEVFRINFHRGLKEGRRLAGRLGHVHTSGGAGSNVHGYLFSDSIHATGQSIPSNHMVVPSVSPVIVLTVSTPLTYSDVNVAEILAACISAHAGLIVHSQRSGERGQSSRIECQADNAHVAHLALTSRHLPVQGFDFDGISSAVEISTSSGIVEKESFTANTQALMHLTDSVRQSISALGPILPGELLVTPTMGRPLEFPLNANASADFGKFGTVRIEHSGAEFEEGFLPMNIAQNGVHT